MWSPLLIYIVDRDKKNNFRHIFRWKSINYRHMTVSLKMLYIGFQHYVGLNSETFHYRIGTLGIS